MNSYHPQGLPGYAHGYGYSITWGESGDGARPEEVLRAVLERIQFLQNMLPCDENLEIIKHLNQAMDWEETRNRRRKEQGVHGIDAPHISTEAQHGEHPAPPAHEETAHVVHQPKPAELALEEHPCPLAVAMPCQENRYIPEPVMRSMIEQEIPFRLWVSTTYSNNETAAMRQNVADMALQSNSPYILTADNDLAFPPGCWQAMLEFMEANPDFAMIGVSKHGDPDSSRPGMAVESPHVDAAPCCFRREVLVHAKYSNAQGCECASMVHTLRHMHRETFEPIESDNDLHMGWKCGFLAGWSVKHFHNTRLDIR